MKVEILRELVNESKATQVLVKRGDDEYFIVSTVVPTDTNLMETLVFPSNESGEWLYSRVCGGGIGWTREQAIAELEGGDPRSYEEIRGETIAAAGGPEEFVIKTVKGVLGINDQARDQA